MKINKNDEVIHQALKLVDSDKSELFINEFRESLASAIEKTHGVSSALIESAVILDDKEQKSLEQVLTEILKKKFKVRYQIKPYLISGFKITVGDWKLDASLITQLEGLRENLKGKE